MSGPSDDEREVLTHAVSRTETLLQDLTCRQRELENNPPKLPAAQLAAGRLAMQNAISSANRVLTALREACDPGHAGGAGKSSDAGSHP